MRVPSDVRTVSCVVPRSSRKLSPRAVTSIIPAFVARATLRAGPEKCTPLAVARLTAISVKVWWPMVPVTAPRVAAIPADLSTSLAQRCADLVVVNEQAWVSKRQATASPLELPGVLFREIEPP